MTIEELKHQSYHMPVKIIETIRKRKSCRTFIPVFLRPADKKILEDYITENKGLPGHELTELHIIEKKEEEKKLKLNYGMIQGHTTYLLGTSKSLVDSRVNFGFLMEKVVLKATEIGISTCWIGYFDPDYFNDIAVENGSEIPSIVILGYSKEKESATDSFIRFAVKGSKRLDREKLFFNYNSGTPLKPEMVQEYYDSLEMLRLAPSAGNTQPWRVFFDDAVKVFHFFKKPVNESYERRGLHDVDLGIALSHFELTSSYNNLSGSWIKFQKDEITSNSDMQYIISWKCK